MQVDPENSDSGVPPDEEDLVRIRHILLEEVEKRLQSLEFRLGDSHQRAEEISQVLVEAIHFLGSHPEPLARALRPPLEESIKDSVSRNPKTFGDALFPVMGPAIRKSILETIRSMILAMNQVVEKSLSTQGLKWRWEAFRKKKTYGEIAFLNSMKYRVEQVFLIHRETGLLLNHVVNGSVPFENADAVSGMLTAIKDFVEDSFGSDSHGEVNLMQVGDLTVWIEGGPFAVLAATVRGTPPQHLGLRLQSALEHLHLVHGNELRNFDGKTDSFERSRPELENCLLQETKEQEKPKKRGWILTSVFAAALLVAASVFVIQRFKASSSIDSLVMLLEQTPGIICLDVHRERGQVVFKGLKDPLAILPLTVETCQEKGYQFQWEPYYSLEPKIILKRVEQILQPPKGISFSFDEGTLLAHGVSHPDWEDYARERALFIPGIQELNLNDLSFSGEALINEIRKQLAPPEGIEIAVEKGWVLFSGVANWDWIQSLKRNPPELKQIKGFNADSVQCFEGLELARLEKDIGATILFYDQGESSIRDDQQEKSQNLTKWIVEAISLSQQLGKSWVLEIRGHSDYLGTEPQNVAISLRRAQGIKDVFSQAGIVEKFLRIKALGSSEPLKTYGEGEDPAQNRRVEFKVVHTEDTKP